MYVPGTIYPDEKMLESITKLGKLGDIAAIGCTNLLKIMLTSLGMPLFGIPELEKRISRALGCYAEIPQCSYPSFAFDIDLVEDFTYAEEFLARKG